MPNFPIREGYVSVAGGRVWYQRVGDGAGVPLLTLHGGPGYPHHYLTSLAALADERPVIFYDQLGCGQSDRPDDVSLWRVERFVEELGQVRHALGLARIHLLGQSWGTMLAADYMLTQPKGVMSLIMASPCLSIPRWVQDANKFRGQLPVETQARLVQHEAAGTTSSEEYQAAMMEYYQRHVCRLDPWPAELMQTLPGVGESVYATMWGPSEFHLTGILKDYDRTARLSELNAPILFTCGRYDEATPEATAWYQSLTPNSELVIFEQSAHMAHLEERELYMQVARDFLRRCERRAST